MSKASDAVVPEKFFSKIREKTIIVSGIYPAIGDVQLRVPSSSRLPSLNMSKLPNHTGRNVKKESPDAKIRKCAKRMNGLSPMILEEFPDQEIVKTELQSNADFIEETEADDMNDRLKAHDGFRTL
ncbi:hypothetical protein AVEN_80799-1 [Araneus ventricosus]|uniref:Uncharacterized protein n=1 Tax=Araneus ventricosus TaxID=182803 RepID=A0A4Y2FHR1_ARAVE|nr:hypothetical protein AVEN_80799-1 [Araneus ventricosus]